MLFDASRSSDLIWGWLAEASYGAVTVALRRLGQALGKSRPGVRQIFLGIALLLLIVLNLAFFYLIPQYFAILSTISIALAGIYAWLEFRRSWSVGIVGVDAHIGGGLDYKRSLELTSNSLDFLGIGASKLTKEHTAFHDALQRCNRPTRSIRFLLCHPQNEELEHIARSAGRDNQQYRRNVIESLRSIARLRNERQWNIEVRFYKRMPLFRLMFMDGWLCLASHYVFGEGEGDQLPQLHVSNRGQQVKMSLYYPFERYFTELWDASDTESWDFGTYLD